MTNEYIKELVEAFGWHDMGKQKNVYMLSFYKEDMRMNVYFTTGTITIQHPRFGIRTWRDVKTLSALEDVCLFEYAV